jgi:S1-C subfamily serine protease
MSAYGTPGETGILVLEVPAGIALAEAGLQKDDVIFYLNGKTANELAQLIRATAVLKAGKKLRSASSNKKPAPVTVRVLVLNVNRLRCGGEGCFHRAPACRFSG